MVLHKRSRAWLVIQDTDEKYLTLATDQTLWLLWSTLQAVNNETSKTFELIFLVRGWFFVFFVGLLVSFLAPYSILRRNLRLIYILFP